VLIIEAMIRRSDIQKYVNMIRFTVESTESVKSSIFTFFTVKFDAVKSDDLSIDQQRDLAILRKNHKKTLRTYRERIEALKKSESLHTDVSESVQFALFEKSDHDFSEIACLEEAPCLNKSYTRIESYTQVQRSAAGPETGLESAESMIA
jgi:phage anti-repressor protein